MYVNYNTVIYIFILISEISEEINSCKACIYFKNTNKPFASNSSPRIANVTCINNRSPKFNNVNIK